MTVLFVNATIGFSENLSLVDKVVITITFIFRWQHLFIQLAHSFEMESKGRKTGKGTNFMRLLAISYLFIVYIITVY